MNDEHLVRFLRSRAQVEPPADFVARTMAAVDAASESRWSLMAFVPAAAVAAVVAVVVVVGLLIGQGVPVGPAPTPSPEPSRSGASLEDLRAALWTATDVLRQAPGVEGTITTQVFDELAGATWFTWRPGGDQIVVERVDVDVAETGWWLDPASGPPAAGRNIRTTIRILVGADYFEGTGDGWAVSPAFDAPSVLSMMTGALDAETGLGGVTPGAETYDVSVTQLDDGGEEWTLSAPFRDGTTTSRWRIGPGGGLETWTNEFDGVSPTVEDTQFVTGSHVEIRTLSGADPIEPPDTAAPPDPAALGLPEDFPLGTDGSSALEFDYFEYVETALDILEAYHWNTDAIDWDAARAAALDGLGDDPTAGEAHRRIREAIQTFDTFNTVFLRPDDASGGSGPPRDPIGLRNARFGEIGYLRLPALDAGDPEDVRAYLREGRTLMEAIESTVPACGWIVDVRDTARGSYPALFGVVAGLLGEGRVITYDSALGDWWVDVNADGTLSLGGEERTADLLDSPAIARATAEQEREDLAFVAMLEREPAYLPANRDAPVVVLTSNATAAAGEQLVVGFRGRPATRVMGAVTAGSPHGQMSLEMVDGARLRFPVSTVVDRDGTTYDTNLVPDEIVPVGGSQGPDPAIDPALEWLERQPGCS